MTNPDRDMLMTVIRLKGDPNFDKFCAWLQQSCDTQSRNNNHELDRDRSNQNKGRALELEELLSLIKTAETDFKRQQELPKGLV
jgi:hypothetical protein